MCHKYLAKNILSREGCNIKKVRQDPIWEYSRSQSGDEGVGRI